MKYIIRPWRLRLIMVLSLTPVFVGYLFSFYAWSSRANQAYRYPYESVKIDSLELENEIDFYKERIRRTPSAGLDRASLASTYLRLARATGDTAYYQLAEASAQQSLANLPNSAAQLVLAQIAEAEHDFSTTLKLAQQILRTEPSNPEAQTLLVTSHLAMGAIPKASQIAQQLVDQTPTLGTFTLLALVQDAQGQDEDAVRSFEHALAAEEPGEAASSAKTRTLMGRFYRHRGKTQQARQLFQEALRILPRYSFALLEQAKLETLVGNYQQAETLFTQVDITAHEHDTLHGRALLKLLQGDRNSANQLWSQAEKSFRHHEEEQGEHHHGQEHHSSHGHSHAHPHNHGQQQDESHHYFGHHRDLARLLLARGRTSDLPEALGVMQAEVKIRRDAKTLNTLAWALQQSGQMEAANKILLEAIQLGTRDAELFYRAGTVARALGNEPQAIDYFRTAQQLNPNFDQKLRQILRVG